MKKILLYSMSTLVLGFLVLALVILLYSNKTHLNGDGAIVLGAAAWGNKPSPVFQARIDHAISLYKNGTISKIYFTGGKSVEGEPSEAEVAQRYTISKGINPDDIFIETLSRTTFDNLKNIAPYLDNEDVILIITDPLHEFRSVSMARKLGIRAYPSPTPFTKYTSVKTKVPFLLQETYFTIIN